jgi:hypothetical protein
MDPRTPPTVPLAAQPVAGGAGISGRVTDQYQQPAANTFVYAYRNPRSNLRGPADFAAPTDPAGNYFLDLSAGDYYLVARQRQDGSDAGRPRPGDAWALPAANPVRVTLGRTSQVDFQLRSMQQSPVLGDTTLTGGATGFTGLLLDDQGQPVAGAFVLAYRDADFHRMPDHTSLPVDAGGRFILYLPEGGTWCLAARGKTRGQPMAGEPYGVLDGCPQLGESQILDVGAIVLRPYRR